MADLIDGQQALKKLAVYIHLIDKTMGKGLLTDADCMEAAKSVLGEDELPAVQPETATVTIGRTKGGVVMWYECDTCGESINQKDCYCRNCGRKLTLPDPYLGGGKDDR